MRGLRADVRRRPAVQAAGRRSTRARPSATCLTQGSGGGTSNAALRDLRGVPRSRGDARSRRMPAQRRSPALFCAPDGAQQGVRRDGDLSLVARRRPAHFAGAWSRQQDPGMLDRDGQTTSVENRRRSVLATHGRDRAIARSSISVKRPGRSKGYLDSGAFAFLRPARNCATPCEEFSEAAPRCVRTASP